MLPKITYPFMRFSIRMIFFLFVGCLSNDLWSQESTSHELKGIVLDASSEVPLEYANIVATDSTGNEPSVFFTMTDGKGYYELMLKGSGAYKIEVSYLGYRKHSEVVDIQDSQTVMDFSLEVLDTELSEVVITSHVPPIIYKEDTILYNASSFSDGSERKLRELLQQMPGIEIDEQNNIFVEGRKVDRLLVEGKPFFGGDSELAVKSLPADAVKTVEVLKEYNKVSFLSSVSGDNEMAMNIKLKEEKKRFVFGEVEAGGGWEKRGMGRTDLFYYSPEVNAYGIGGINNTNQQLMSMKQWLQLQGGMEQLSTRNSGSILNQSSKIIDHLMLPQNGISSISKMGALGLDFSLSKHYQLNTYLIYSDEKGASEYAFINQYYADDEIILEESRADARLNKEKRWLLNTDFIYEDNEKDYLSVSLGSSLNRLMNEQQLNSFGLESNVISQEQNRTPKEINMDLDWNRKHNDKNISTTEFNFTRKRSVDVLGWNNESQPFLINELPWVQEVFYQVRQDEFGLVSSFQGQFKHYYILNKKNHFSATIGNNYLFNNLDIVSQQELSDGTFVSFGNEDISNRQKIYFNDFFSIFNYRHKWKRKAEFEIGFSTHQLNRMDRGLNAGSQSYFFMLPFFKIESNIPKIGEIEFKYEQKRNLPRKEQIYIVDKITNFNSIYQGNASLAMESSHNLSLDLNKSNIFKKTHFFFRSLLTLTNKSIQQSVLTDGLNQKYLPYMSSAFLYRSRNTASYTKEWGVFRFRPRLTWTTSSLENKVDGEALKTYQNRLDIGWNLRCKFKKRKNLTFSYKKSFAWFRQSGIQTINNTDQLKSQMNMGLAKGWMFRTEYSFISFKGGNTSANHLLDVTVEYQKENHPLTVRLTAHNILDNKSILSRNTTGTFISQSEELIFPFYAMLSLSYEL